VPINTRGSVANSLVAYCAGITHVDPIAHGLLFERFLNPARADLPDIDLDFCSNRRDQVLDYVRRPTAPITWHWSARQQPAPSVGARETAKAHGLDERRSALWRPPATIGTPTPRRDQRTVEEIWPAGGPQLDRGGRGVPPWSSSPPPERSQPAAW